MKKITLDVLRAAVNAQPDTLTGLLVERAILKGAFDLVAPQGDWRGAINATLHVDHCDYSPDVIARAVSFFTATEATIETLDCNLRIKARGYRAGPAA